MTDRIPLYELRQMVNSPAELNGQTFGVLRELRALTNSRNHRENALARDLTIRVLSEREQVGEQYQDLLAALVRSHGLFPYLNPVVLRAESDLLAYEAHRPEGLDDADIVFHRVQGAIYYHLLDGDNVILSAPTSFGKSLIIDALLASGRYSNVVIVVPTLALIDETRRRLAQRFADSFKIVTHPSQRTEERNVFVYTQERVVDQEMFPRIDLFVIDEFYKLDSADEERSGLLNQALYRLLKTGAQLYFLGPNIERIAPDLPARFNARFFQTDFSTVAIDVLSVQRRGSDLETLVELCSGLSEPTLIYCQSPRQTRTVATALLEAGLGAESPDGEAAARWIAENYDPAWLVGKAVGRGIGIHSGRIPRALAQFMVRTFNSGGLRFLVCTSTLIEGVNTAAKNVVVFSDRISTRRFDFFTFNNIRGRSGRMFHHFVGRVYLFHPEPQAELPFVDVPVITQPATTPSSLLVQLEPEDLTPESQARMAPILSQTDLGVGTIRENKGVSPERQVEIAADLRRRARQLHPLLAWSGFPQWEQLRETAGFVWRLSGFSGRVSGVSSGAQLALKLSRLQRNPETWNHIQALAQGDAGASDGDERVEGALEFVRQWAGHHAPRLFLGLDRIQREVFGSLGYRPGSYGFYVGRLHNLFLPPALAAVDEYGLPIEVALKIQDRLDLRGELDDLLDSIRSLQVDEVPLTDFERKLLRDTQQSLGPRRSG
jgi:rhodanese-related sulfurtransferase